MMKWIKSIALVGILLFAGCAVPTSAENNILTENSLQNAEEISVTPDAIAFPTVTPVPTLSPTPTLTPTPTPTPSVYNQIINFETGQKSDDTKLPVGAALLVNLSEDSVLYSQNATDIIYPASITKLMTALVALSSGEDLTQTVEISNTAATPVISTAKMCGFKAGDRILFRDLLKCMLIYSGNDTSLAVAEHMAGSEADFVSLMNQKAAELNMSSTWFCNSHGLPDDNHVTSAYDIYLIMEKLFNFEEFLGIIESGSIEVDVLRGDSLKTYHFVSTNQFLTGAYQLPEGIKMLGGKTGTTNKAGCCLTLYVQDVSGNCYIAEIFGAESYEALYVNMIQLLEKISDI